MLHKVLLTTLFSLSIYSCMHSQKGFEEIYIKALIINNSFDNNFEEADTSSINFGHSTLLNSNDFFDESFLNISAIPLNNSKLSDEEKDSIELDRVSSNLNEDPNDSSTWNCQDDIQKKLAAINNMIQENINNN